MHKIIDFILVIASATALMGCSTGEYRKASGSTWGTFYNITYKADADLADSITAVMARIDSSLSMFNDSSTVSRINRGDDITVDADFITVFNKAREVAAVSGGRFDPTVGPLVNLWGFGREDIPAMPSDSAIAAALTSVGIDSCLIAADGHVVKKSPSTTFDFSAIAKGYGCDAVAAMLRRNGCTDYLVEIGGEMAISGVNPRSQTWHIQIDAPIEGDDNAIVSERAATVSVTDCGVATSGNYRNYRDLTDGRRVAHTISPLTGCPVAGEILSATIIAPDCMTADALATASMTMTVEEAKRMIESLRGVSALLITAGPAGDDSYTLTRVGPFPGH